MLRNVARHAWLVVECCKNAHTMYKSFYPVKRHQHKRAVQMSKKYKKLFFGSLTTPSCNRAINRFWDYFVVDIYNYPRHLHSYCAIVLIHLKKRAQFLVDNVEYLVYDLWYQEHNLFHAPSPQGSKKKNTTQANENIVVSCLAVNYYIELGRVPQEPYKRTTTSDGEAYIVETKCEGLRKL